ncbi:substrate-binding domain-containing protein [Pseudalkalibacillus decolorationis]|uniref:substrate-binding domain-containing protein n=1 Tax=Pseudalkalibacillus decolorationis TaxID=163879 RepID=UPI002148E0DD|nr:substrate-binding domain-containing protein [Pseudalkalibacillus decolorationis]
MSKENIHVPNEVSIVSFNNSLMSRFSTPPLTSIDTQTYQLGFEATKCLMELINEPNQFKRSVVIPTIIVERESYTRREQKVE